MFTFSLLGLSLRSLMRHLSHFPFVLQKNQGASELVLMVWMIPRVWDRILHASGNRKTSLINASRSFVWLSFYLSPGCFAATILSQKNWAMCSAVPMIIQVILWHTGHCHVLEDGWEAELAVRWNTSVQLQLLPHDTPQSRKKRGQIPPPKLA